MLSVAMTGCGSLSGDVGGSDGSGSEVRLAAVPTPGMRASYRVQTAAHLSGPGVRLLAESQKSASTSQRYVVAVTAIEADAFDVRITGDSLQGVVIARFNGIGARSRSGSRRRGPTPTRTC